MEDLRDLKIVVADTETTGLTPPIGICEVAWCEITPDLGVVEEKDFLINPQMPIPCSAAHLNGIRDEMVINEPTIDQIKFPEGPVLLVAHNAKYDAPLLAPYMDIRATCCTYVLARRLLPDAEMHKLSYLSCYLGLPPQISHRAYGDVRDCLGILDYLVEGTGWDIYKLTEYSNTPQLLKTMPFGKHKGLPMAAVPKSYITWLVNQGGEIDVDMKFTMRELWGIEV